MNDTITVPSCLPKFSADHYSSLLFGEEDDILGERAPILKNMFYTSSDCTYEVRRESLLDCGHVTGNNHGSRASQSSIFFESFGPVVVPLSQSDDFLVKRINFVKKWYLLMHISYILLLSFIGSLLFFAIEKDLQFIDAFFIAMSCVCCCGLQTVDVSTWSVASTLLRHLLAIFGGIVVTSSYQPLLRLWMLKKMWHVFESNPADSAQEKVLRISKRMCAERLWYTSVICFCTPLVFFGCVNISLMIFLAAFNRSNLSFLKVFQITLSSFNGSTFLPMEQYVEDVAVVLVVTIGCAFGFTFFPVVLRFFFYAEWCAYFFGIRVKRQSQSVLTRCRGDSASAVAVKDLPRHVDAPPLRRTRSFFNDIDVLDQSVIFSPWDSAFRDILESKEPVCFHAYLFIRSETLYIFVAWWVITVAQAIPFWVQQWSGDGLLASFSAPYKIFLSICQAAVVRFAAASFVTCLKYSEAHVFFTVFFMFLPALPIPTDRTYRKWKQLFCTSVIRLLTSRLFWLFAAVLCILVAEEEWLFEKLNGLRFDATTRIVFEVISAYSGSGMSLTFSNSMVSFVGFLGTFSKLVIVFVMLAGRNRMVDLGVDLGFAGLCGGGCDENNEGYWGNL